MQELHVSGGSDLPAWPGDPRTVRCDTHDDRAPAEVFELVRKALEHCPRIKVVIFERLGTTLTSEDAYEAFRSDVQTLRTILDETPTPSEPRALRSSPAMPDLIEDDAAALASFQDEMLSILLDHGAPHLPTWKTQTQEYALCTQIRNRLQTSARGTPYETWIAGADDRALGIAARAVATHLRKRDA